MENTESTYNFREKKNMRWWFAGILVLLPLTCHLATQRVIYFPLCWIMFVCLNSNRSTSYSALQIFVILPWNTRQVLLTSKSIHCQFKTKQLSALVMLSWSQKLARRSALSLKRVRISRTWTLQPAVTKEKHTNPWYTMQRPNQGPS